jgi:hypothetical protein
MAKWLINNWEPITELRKEKVSRLAKAMAAPKVTGLSILLVLFLWYALHELSVSTDVWWSSFVLLCLAVLPTWIVFSILETVLMVRDVTRSVVNRIGFFVVIGFMFWFARAAVSDELNKIFPFDPTLMPVALTAGAFLVIAGISAIPTLIITFGMELICFLMLFDKAEREKVSSLRRFLTVILPVALFLGLFTSSSAMSRIGLSELRKFLISRLAFDYDFNEHHLCSAIENGKSVPLKKGEKVLFIGSSEDKGIAAQANDIPRKTIAAIKKKDIQDSYPKDFRVVACNQFK